MAKQQYKGSLSLEWYNKNKSIIIRDENAPAGKDDIPAPRINWINKDQALFYEIDESEGRGLKPYWVERNDIRVKETRPLVFQKTYKANPKVADLTGEPTGYDLLELDDDDPSVENILIRGDNLLALNTLKKIFNQKPEEEKVKCIYIDPPYTTGNAFDDYDDCLSQSEWLTLIRDRLIIFREILRDDGVVFIQLDEKNIFHTRVMLDEIFGKNNFLNLFTVKTSDPSGHRTVNPSPYDAAEYILMYAKNKSFYRYETIYVKSSHDFGYNKYITNISDDFNDWEIVSLNEYIANENGFEKTRAAKAGLGEAEFERRVAQFAIDNCNSIFQATAIANDAGREIVELRDESRNNKGQVLKLEREGDDIFVLNGRQIYFYSNKVMVIDGEKVPTKHLTNIWMDIPYNGISSEGGVVFRESKKPEKLIMRLIQVSNAQNGDLVLDAFGGSGTTFAVANKMGMKWVGIELGEHADTHIIPRMKGVTSGQDQSGISQTIDWQGGGSFKYYHLGPSIIEISEDGKGDLSWQLGRPFIEESLLSSYDYVQDDRIKLPAIGLFEEDDKPKVGTLQVGTKVMAAVCSLNEPGGEREMMNLDEIEALYKTLKTEYSPEFITIFTNRGVEMALDSKPDDLEIIKVPHAIFAELEK